MWLWSGVRDAGGADHLEGLLLSQVHSSYSAPGSGAQWALSSPVRLTVGPRVQGQVRSTTLSTGSDHLALPTGPNIRASTASGRGSVSASAACRTALLAAPPSAMSSAATLTPCCTRASCTRGCPWSTMVSPAAHGDTEAQQRRVSGPRVSCDTALGCSPLSSLPVCSHAERELLAYHASGLL